MHPALRKGPLFTKSTPIFYFFYKKTPPFHFLPTGCSSSYGEKKRNFRKRKLVAISTSPEKTKIDVQVVHNHNPNDSGVRKFRNGKSITLSTKLFDGRA